MVQLDNEAIKHSRETKTRHSRDELVRTFDNISRTIHKSWKIN